MMHIDDALNAQLTFVKQPERSAEQDTAEIEGLVKTVLDDVRNDGDAAVAKYARKFDNSDLEAFEVTAQDREAALAQLDPQTRADTEFAIDNVRRFAQAQMDTILPLEVELHPGIHLGHRVIPIERVGCYVPGGRFPLLSAPIMSLVPAKVAGCDEVVACLPPNAHPCDDRRVPSVRC